jgi:hypothetical protein
MKIEFPQVSTSRMVLLSTALLMAAPLLAQTTMVPETSANTGPIDTQHQKDVPYGPSLPKPLYPSTERVQKEFTVRYIYDYAMSTYTPAITLPKVPRAQVDRSTPEGALIALVSAVQLGDYDGWIQCWDEAGQKFYEDDAKAHKRDNAQWMKAYQQSLAGKSIVLTYRIETVGYVVLDIRIVDPAHPNVGTPAPTVFKRVNGQWMSTNDLSASHFLGYFQNGVAGVDNRISPAPLAGLTGAGAQEGEAQQIFLDRHAVVSSVAQAAR